jgi:membrane associated rhomboid family serine protease
LNNYYFFCFIIIAINVILSIKGYDNQAFVDGYKFHIDKVLVQKDYLRLVSSAFLHADYKHLIYNMLALFMFGVRLEGTLGSIIFLLIYFGSLLGSKLFAIYVHRNHGDYSSIGASGAVSGIVFGSIALFPGISISFLPGWLFGILYVGYSIYGIKTQKDNIGHESHLGGALAGILLVILFNPSVVIYNYIVILLISMPILAFLILIINRPHILMFNDMWFPSKKSKNKFDSIDHKYNEIKINKQQELDGLLDKIANKGIDSLSKKEKIRLEELSV